MRLKPATTAVTSLLGAGLGAGAAAVAAGRYGAGTALKPTPGRPAGFGGRPLTVRAVDDGLVTLAPHTAAAALPQRYGLTGGGLHAVVGPVVEDGAPDRVVRRLERVLAGEPKPGQRVRLTPQVYAGTPADALGLAYEDVTVDGPDGPLPAWYVPGSRGTWVIAAHGLGATCEQALGALPLLHGLGLPVLVPAYRGDPGAPRPEGGVVRFGHAEWPDLAAVVRWAVQRGARRLVLYGWSVGAAMALRAAESWQAERVTGLILDSPVLDWTAAVRALAGPARTHRRMALPESLLRLAVLAAAERTGLDSVAPADIRAERGAGGDVRVAVPTLLLQGTEDVVAPYGVAREFAARQPDDVLVHEVRGGRHAALWNADPEVYEETVRRFLVPLL